MARDPTERGRRGGSPALTIAAFALLAFIIFFVVGRGHINMTDDRITIDIPVLHLRGEGNPDIDMAR